MKDEKIFTDYESMDKLGRAIEKITKLYPSLEDFERDATIVYSPIKIVFKEGISDEKKKAIMDILTKHYCEK